MDKAVQFKHVKNCYLKWKNLILKPNLKGVWSYSYAIREKCEDGQHLETRTPVDRREYAVKIDFYS